VLGNRVQHRLAALGKQDQRKNIEILEEKRGRESIVLTGYLPGKWSANRNLAPQTGFEEITTDVLERDFW
jgi:hypothetical protein